MRLMRYYLTRLRLKIEWPERETIEEAELGMGPSIGGGAGLGTSASGVDRGNLTKKRIGSALGALAVYDFHRCERRSIVRGGTVEQAVRRMEDGTGRALTLSIAETSSRGGASRAGG